MPTIKKRSAPATTPTAGPGNTGPLAVNLPAGRVRTSRQPGPRPPDLRLPHERDQSAVDATSDAIDPVVAQAARDLAAGLVDTDLHNQPGLDAERQRALLKRERER